MLSRWYSKLSLRTKVTGVALLIIVSTLSVVATTGILQIRRLIASEQRRSADAIALGVSRASELAMAVLDGKEVERLSRSFLRDDTVLFILVTAPDGTQLGKVIRDQTAWEQFQAGTIDTERVLVGTSSVEGQAANKLAMEDESDSAAASSPRSKSAVTHPLGRIFVGISTANAIGLQQQQSRFVMAIAIGAGLVGATILFAILGPWIGRLQRLTLASQSISNGDFSNYISDKGDDEIGRLAQSFDSMCAALRERDGKLRCFTSTLQEQVKQRTQQLENAVSAAEEASRSKSLFLANMSHELRTPLNGVIGMVDLLLAATPSAQQRRYCDVAKTSARSLLELINDILDFSKIEAGRLELDNTEFNLHELVEGVAQMLGERADAKKVELLCALGPDVPRGVGGDPVRLRQIVTNLVTNAIKFTSKGAVVIRAALLEETDTHATIKISVQDSGIGIPKDRLDRLFKSFSQVDASTTRKFGGTGLGLAISQRIVEMMNGTIGVDSEEGKGSTFWFSARLEKRQLPQTSQRESKRSPRGLRVLAVDDNTTNREILHAQLMSWSLRPDVACDAGEALEKLRSASAAGQPYRFAILDMHMPHVDGTQLARRIKDDPAIKDVILISLSSLGEQLNPAEREHLGFSACLTKPSLPSQLYDALVDSLASVEPSFSPSITGAAATQLPAAMLAGARILLAEDNEINRYVASEMLQQAGCIVSMAVDGKEAVAAAMASEFDIILMDCQMPELDGFAATREIRAIEARTPGACHRPIIALTANAIKGDRELCLAAGMDDYVTKPIDPPSLLAAIRSLLQSPAKVIGSCVPGESAVAPTERPIIAISTPELAGKQTIAAAPAPQVVAMDVKLAQPPSDLPVDIESLTHRCLGNRKIAAKILGKFEGALKRDVDALAQGVAAGDAPMASAAAHKIKGAAANVSAEGVRRVAGELERLAKADDLGQAQAFVDELTTEMARFREYLSTALGNLGVTPETAGAPSNTTATNAAKQ